MLALTWLIQTGPLPDAAPSSARAESADQILGAGARQEATDLWRPFRIHIGPHHGRAVAIRLSHDRRVRNINPFAVEPHPIAAVLRIPVDVLDAHAVGKRTAQAFPARELIEPRMERRVGIAAVIARGHAARNQSTHAQRHNRQSTTGESVHRGLQMIVLRALTTKSPADLEKTNRSAGWCWSHRLMESNFRAVYRITPMGEHHSLTDNERMQNRSVVVRVVRAHMDVGVARADHHPVVAVEQQIAVETVGPGLHREEQAEQHRAVDDRRRPNTPLRRRARSGKA